MPRQAKPHQDLTVSVADARSIILGSLTPLAGEMVPILEAHRRVLHEDVVADAMIPPLDCSAMDGYAVIAADTRGASPESPVSLRVIGENQAGGPGAGEAVTPGTAVRIMTGAPMPQGADAVVKVEETQERGGLVRVFGATAPYRNYRVAGENIKRGDVVLYRGDRLGSADLGILASLNRDTVRVYRQPRVAVISTGDELAGLGEEMEFGRIRDVNAYALCSEVERYGGRPAYLGIARDTLDDVREMFLKAADYDVVISTGGASMGRYDFVKDIYGDLGIEIKFAWVKVRPGKPCAFGVKGGRLFFGLPGNPVSALTSFIQFVRPALLRLMGARRINKPVVSAVLKEDIRGKQAGKVHLLRGVFGVEGNQLFVSTTGDQKSSVFRSMSNANCLIVIPESVAEVRAGQSVAIQLIDHEEIE